MYNFYGVYRKTDIHIHIQYVNKTNLNTERLPKFVSKTHNKKQAISYS